MVMSPTSSMATTQQQKPHRIERTKHENEHIPGHVAEIAKKYKDNVNRPVRTLQQP